MNNSCFNVNNFLKHNYFLDILLFLVEINL